MPSIANRGTCFVICPFGQPWSKTRKRSDKLLEVVISPAVSPLGYSVVRADLDSKPGIVQIQIIEHVLKDALVIADLTDHNPNVSYELAIRHAIRKPFIHVIHHKQAIPFDVQGIQAITYNLRWKSDIEQAVTLIRRQVGHFADSPEVQSPVSLAFESLREHKTAEVSQEILQRLVALDRNVEEVGTSRGAILEAIHEAVRSAVRGEFRRALEEARLNRAPVERIPERGRGEYPVNEFIELEKKKKRQFRMS